MATLDQEDELAMTPPPATPIGPMATPRRMAVPGVNTAGMTAPETQQAQLSMQTDPRYRVYAEKARMRVQNQQGLRLQAIQQAMQRHEAFSDLEGMGQPHENRPSLHTPTGYTHDQHLASDWEQFSPEMKATYEGAVKQYNKEVSRLMSSPDAATWGSTKDLESAWQNLPSIRKYGSVIEGYARSTLMRHLSPEVQAKFKANDANFVEFSKWYQRSGIGAGGQSAEGAWDEMHGTGAFAGEQTQRGALLRQKWETDPNAKKFDVDPATLQVREVPLSQQQRMDMQLQQGERQRQAIEGPRTMALQEAWDANPRLQQVYRRPVAGDKDFEEYPKTEKPKEGEFASPEEARAKAAEMTQLYGDEYEAVYAGGKHTVRQKSEGSQYRQSRDEQVDAFLAAGVPVIKTGKSMVMKGDKAWDEYVEPVIDGKPASPMEVKMAETTGKRISYRVRPEYANLEYRGEGAPTGGANMAPTNQNAELRGKYQRALEQARQKGDQEAIRYFTGKLGG